LPNTLQNGFSFTKEAILLMGGGRWRLKIRANDSSRTERRWGLGVATSAPKLSCRAPSHRDDVVVTGRTRCLRGPGGGAFTRIPMQAGCYYCTSALHVQGVWCWKKKQIWKSFSSLENRNRSNE
jgi:hypothetical protein